MSRDGVLLAVLGAFVAGLLLVAFVGGFGLSTTTTFSGGTPASVPLDPPEDGSAGMVFSLHSQPGTRILGIRVQRDSYRAFVGVVAPSACVRTTDAGGEVLADDGECARLPVHGEVSGGGTTRDGANLVIVRVDISQECYEALEVGAEWPPSVSVCATA